MTCSPFFGSGKVTAARTFQGDDLRNYDPKYKQPRLDHYLALDAEQKRWLKPQLQSQLQRRLLKRSRRARS